MKHKKLTMIVALVLVVALAAGLGIWATGETNVPTVTYYDGSDGNGARFTFTHTGDGSDTNLFPNFSNCMPGDSLTQTIRVQADGKTVCRAQRSICAPRSTATPPPRKAPPSRTTMCSITSA